MSLSLFLARRLPLSSRQGRVGGGIAVAVTGIALSVVVMLLSISVMTGFRDEIRGKIMGFDSQLTVVPRPGAGGEFRYMKLTDIDSVLDILPEGAAVSLSMRQPAIMKSTEDFTGVVVKGMDAPVDWDFVRGNLVAGDVPDYAADSAEYHTVVSSAIAGRLGLGLGDRIDTYFLGGGVYRARRLKIAGIYDTHFADYDKHVVYASMPMLRRVASMPDSAGTMVEITGLGDDAAIDRIAAELGERFDRMAYSGPDGMQFAVSNVHDTAALFFNWLALLDTNVTVILALMALLASLTLVSSLFILILRRVNMIGLLKAIGASNALVRRTFVLLTLRILATGLVVGNFIALGLILLQRATGLIPLDPEAYYLDHVPMALDWGAVAALNCAVAVLAFAVLLLPSAIIATIPPSKAMNYE